MTQRNIKLGIAGLGTVGLGVVKNIINNTQMYAEKYNTIFTITAVSAHSKKDRGVDLSSYQWFDNAVEMAKSADIDVFVELIGGGRDSVALTAICTAIESGKIVITANKALLAECGFELSSLAEKHNTHIYYEAAIAGGIPAVKTLKEALTGNTVNRVSGILNGTCNYILTTIEQTGREFSDVLTEAQQLGYAESDPTFDVDGLDAAQKISLLASIAFGIQPAYCEMHIESIRDCISTADIKTGATLGLRPRLICVAEKHSDGVLLYTVPAFIDSDSVFNAATGVLNCCIYHGDASGQISLIGSGAGQDATASAVMSDIIDISQNRATPLFNVPSSNLKKTQIKDITQRHGYYYLRFDKNNVKLQTELETKYKIYKKTNFEQYCAVVIEGMESDITAMCNTDNETYIRIEKC